MDTFSGSLARVRASALWLAISTGTAGVALLAAPAITTATAPGFTGLLIRGCAAAALAAALGLWVITTDVVLSVLRGRNRGGPRPAGPTRALLLAACGVAALGSPAAASGNSATDPAPGWLTTVVSVATEPDEPAETRPLDGLPLPQRPSSEQSAPRPPGGPDAAQRVVRSGDSLWSIAEEHLPDDASDAEVASYTRALHHHNADLIGDDPDLIHPGQHLDLPRSDGRTHVE